MGNLTRDLELKYTPKGMAIASFGIAINRHWTNDAGEKQEEVTFVDIEMFGKRAEVVGKHFEKGKPIFIEGRLRLDSWEDKTSGKKMQKLRVIAESFEFLGDAAKPKAQEPQESLY